MEAARGVELDIGGVDLGDEGEPKTLPGLAQIERPRRRRSIAAASSSIGAPVKAVSPR